MLKDIVLFLPITLPNLPKGSPNKKVFTTRWRYPWQVSQCTEFLKCNGMDAGDTQVCPKILKYPGAAICVWKLWPSTNPNKMEVMLIGNGSGLRGEAFL